MNFARAARLTLALLLVGLAGAAGSVRSVAENPEPAWTEVSWPFLLDEWGAGQAFRCPDERCGPQAHLFVRVKRLGKNVSDPRIWAAIPLAVDTRHTPLAAYRDAPKLRHDPEMFTNRRLQ